jgi:hypothetical protein
MNLFDYLDIYGKYGKACISFIKKLYLFLKSIIYVKTRINWYDELIVTALYVHILFVSTTDIACIVSVCSSGTTSIHVQAWAL